MDYGNFTFHYVPSPINKALEEQQLIELYQALLAVEKPGHTLQQARDLASILSYAAFRNLIDYDSLIRWIVLKSKQIQIA